MVKTGVLRMNKVVKVVQLAW